MSERQPAAAGRSAAPAETRGRPPLIIVAFYYPPDTQSGAARPHRLAKYLERLGHPVHICAAGNTVDPVVTGNIHRLRGGGVRYPRRDLYAFAERIFRQTLFVHDPGGTWSWRVAAYVSRWMNSAQKPVVFTTAPPATSHMAGYLIKKRYGVRWIADFRDPMRGNPFRPGKVARYFDSYLEPLFFRHADVLIANTDTVKDVWKQQYPEWAHKFHVLWNGFDPEEDLGPRPIPARRQRVLAHVGVIYGERDPHMLLASFDRLIRQGRLNPADYRIEFTGARLTEFMDRELVQRLMDQGALELQDAVPRQEAQNRMSTSDYLLLLDVISGNAGLQVPAKLFEYVRIGRPILSCTKRGSPVDRILSQSGIAYTGLYNDAPPGEIDDRLLNFLKLPPDAKTPSEWFLGTFDARHQAAYLSSLIL